MNKQIRVEYLPRAQLKCAPRNPKAHDLGVIDQSIRRFGFVSPIVLDERTGRLMAGHGRLETLERGKAAGEKPPDRIIEKDGEWLVPVIRGAEFGDDHEAEAYVVADNQTTILGGWNEEELAAVLSTTPAVSADLRASATARLTCRKCFSGSARMPRNSSPLASKSNPGWTRKRK
jgi:ParB-like chromosome segregation protein Spo0J